jgi:hypothetical protein
MQNYIFTAYYYDSDIKNIKVQATTRAKAYEKARIKAIKLKNDLDTIELN